MFPILILSVTLIIRVGPFWIAELLLCHLVQESTLNPTYPSSHANHKRLITLFFAKKKNQRIWICNPNLSLFLIFYRPNPKIVNSKSSSVSSNSVAKEIILDFSNTIHLLIQKEPYSSLRRVESTTNPPDLLHQNAPSPYNHQGWWFLKTALFKHTIHLQGCHSRASSPSVVTDHQSMAQHRFFLSKCSSRCLA